MLGNMTQLNIYWQFRQNVVVLRITHPTGLVGWIQSSASEPGHKDRCLERTELYLQAPIRLHYLILTLIFTKCINIAFFYTRVQYIFRIL